MHIHRLSAEDALRSLQMTSSGLSDDDARRRLVEFGPNRIEPVRRTPAILLFLRELTHFFAIILWIAVGLAFVAEYGSPGQGMATLAFAIIAVILISGAFSFWQQHRAERAIAALQKLLPHDVSVIRAGRVTRLAVSELVPGDLVCLGEGDDVPADCRLIEAFDVRVNNATVTGESLPRARNAAPSDEEDVLQSKNVLLAGTSIVYGRATAVVFATGMRTEFGRIAHLAQLTGEVPSPLQVEIARVSRIVAFFATLLGLLFFAIGRALGLPFSESFLFGIGIIVANVPEGLLPTVTLAMAMASQRMARRNMVIRHLPAVEALGSTSVICTDKTGTLTENRMEARHLFVIGRMLRPEEAREDDLWRRRHRRLLECALLCENVRDTGNGRLIGDPMEIALVEMARSLGVAAVYRLIDEVPFDSDRKRLSNGVLGPLEALAAMVVYFVVLREGGWQHGETLAATSLLYRQATAACLSTIVVTQIANVFLCRSATAPFWRLPHRVNRLILAGIMAEIGAILAIDYTPVGNLLFGTALLPPAIWGFALGFAVLMAVVEEFRKGVGRARSWQQDC